ncbi:Chromosome condensation regulator RCC1 with F-box domain [Orpheovirus IHUMI-LCC2]|uniref:Chromosome condensation regulator RCC1 with F-box domain n=1 Tax=Orpheovirus IHUMI-LCC2 TaxID=2023057 RepID=A0A2I2L546_9VIRU|nr:Chromosome condensation regulator RCC1 with F-box domain [Orpheovirus IHUMI-LCC2]SNW62672.1 Chromosome condensation regulator RCC1 with F-box domain [Orpheovirus IHUMI-LCC2]
MSLTILDIDDIYKQGKLIEYGFDPSLQFLSSKYNILTIVYIGNDGKIIREITPVIYDGKSNKIYDIHVSPYTMHLESSLPLLQYPLQPYPNSVIPSTDNVNRLENLPDEVIQNIAMKMDMEGILSICQSSNRFNSIICNDNIFWKQKYKYEYKDSLDMNNVDWKRLYYENIAGNLYMVNIHSRDNLRENVGWLDNGLYWIKDIKCKTITWNYRGYFIDNNDRLWNIDNNGNIEQVNFDIKVKLVSDALTYTMILDVNNNIWRLDRNSVIPMMLEVPPFICQKIVSGDNYSLMLDDHGNIWSLYKYEDLAIGSPIGNYNRIFENAIDISISDSINLVLDKDNNVWVFGEGHGVELGLGIDKSKTRNKYLQSYEMFISDAPKPTRWEGVKAKKVIAGHRVSGIIDMDDRLLIIGDNRDGSIGNVDHNHIYTLTYVGMKAKDAVLQYNYSMILGLDNSIWVSGNTDQYNYNIKIFNQISNIKAKKIAGSLEIPVIIGL